MPLLSKKETGQTYPKCTISGIVSAQCPNSWPRAPKVFLITDTSGLGPKSNLPYFFIQNHLAS